jgi:hypothetical protein
MYKSGIIGCFLLLISGVGIAQAPADFLAPRTEWNQPDLQGVWNFASDVPMQRPAQFGEREFLTADEIEQMRARLAALDAASDQAVPGLESETNPGGYNDFWVESAGITEQIRSSHIVYPSNGRYPPLVDGVAMVAPSLGEDYTHLTRPVRFQFGGISKDGPEDRGPSERCLTGFNAGPPISPSLYNNNLQIFQNRDHVVIMTEMVHDARVVPLDGRPPLDAELTFWSGDSRGYWDGDTLVVVTTHFNGLTQSVDGLGTSRDKTLIERFTRVGPLTIEYEFTVDDPATFSDRITGIIPLTKVGGLLYEYACHEGNYGMLNLLRGARVEEQRSGTAESN